MVVRNVAIFTGGAVLGAIAMGTYFKAKEEAPKAIALVPAGGSSQQQLPVPVPPTSSTLPPQVPAKTTPESTGPQPPVVARPSPVAVSNPRSILPHGFPGE